MRSALLYLTLIYLTILYGCKYNSKADREGFLGDPKNGLVQSESRGKILYQINFRPSDLLDMKRSNEQKLKKLYFIFSISANGKELLKQLPYASYSEMVQILSFRMADYIKAINADGTVLHPDNCLFMQTYGMSRSNQLLITFPSTEILKQGGFTIQIDEFGLSSGNLKFHFDTDKILSAQP